MRNATARSLFVMLLLAPWSLSHAQSKPKLPKEKQLDRDAKFIRDASGEVRLSPPSSKPPDPQPRADTGMGASPIRSRVKLVQASCSATGADGSAIRGLAREDFRLSADNRPEQISTFDSSTDPAHIVLLLDASPSEYRSLENMKAAAQALAAELSADDEVAVIAFAGHAHLILPFSTDRTLLEQALSRVQLMRNAEEVGSNIYSSLFLAAVELFSSVNAAGGRKSVVLLSDGQDTSLKLSWDPSSMSPPASGGNFLTFEDVVRELSSTGIEVFAISTETRPAAMTQAWVASHATVSLISSESRRLDIPAYTIFLAELVRRAGGVLYFLREIGDLSSVYRRIAAHLKMEYQLGFYPDGAAAQPGWHSLEIQTGSERTRGTTQLSCRPAYYIPHSSPTN